MRGKWSRFFAAALTGLLTTTVALNAHADRRSSLSGNLLITDQDDIYIYPQLTLDHRNLVSFDYYPGGTVLGLPGSAEEDSGVADGTNAMGGAGLLLFGQESFAFGISSHREDQFGATAGAFLGGGDVQLYGPTRLSAWGYLGHNSPLSGGNMQGSPGGDPSGAGPISVAEPSQFADLLFGFKLAPEHAMGARLSIGQHNRSINTVAIGSDSTVSWNTTVLDLVLGYSLRSTFDLDLNLELGLAFFGNEFVTDQPVPNYNDSGSLAPSFSLSGRAIVPMQEQIKLGVLGLVHVNASEVTNEFGATGPTTADSLTVSAMNFFLETGAGPIYQLPDDTTIAAYGTLGFGTSSYDFNGGDEKFSNTSLMLPGFKLALEHWLYDWMAFRTGLTTRYYFAFQDREFDNENEPNVSESGTFYEFMWSVGLGLKLGNFELNGTLTTPMVTDGPAIISGSQNSMFSLLNATYKF